MYSPDGLHRPPRSSSDLQKDSNAMLSRALTRHLFRRSQEAFRTSSCGPASSNCFQHTQASEEDDTGEFRELVRDFAAREVAPHAAEIDRNNAFPTHKNLWTEMGHMGLHGEDTPGSEEFLPVTLSVPGNVIT